MYRLQSNAGWEIFSPLDFFQAVLLGLILSASADGQSLPSPSDESIQKAYIADYELLKANDAGTRIGIAFMHRLYQQQPDLNPEEAARLGKELVQAWKRSYGPDRDADWNSRLRDFKALSKDLIAAVGSSKIRPDFVERGLTITLGEAIRREDELSRRYTLIYGTQALKQSPAAWGSRYMIIQQPEALVDALEFARGNPKASGAMSQLLRQSGQVKTNLDEPIREWLRQHPDAARGLDLAELKAGVANLARNQEELKRRLKDLAKRSGKSAHTLVERIVERDRTNATGRTPAEREAELRAEFAPYFAAHNVLTQLVGKDKNLRALSKMIGIALELAYETVGMYSGALTGWGAVAAIGVTFARSFHVLDEDKPTDTELILDAIRDVRQDIRDLQVYMAREFEGLRRQLYDTLVVIDARFDQLEVAVAYAHRDLRDLMVNNAYAVAMLQQTVNANQVDTLTVVSELAARELKPLRLRGDWATISQEKFNETLDKLWSTAVDSSRDQLETGLSLNVGPEVTADSDQFYKALSSRLSPKVDMWDRLAAVQEAARRFGRRLPVRRIPNPKLWSICAEDYLALARKWEGKYKVYDPDLSKLGTLLQTGNEVRVGTLAIVTTEDGTPSAEFLIAVTAAYRKRVGRIGDSVQAMFDDRRTKQLAGYNPYRTAANQVTAPRWVVNSALQQRELPLAEGFAPSLPKIKKANPAAGDGTRFIGFGFDPDDKSNVIDPTAKLEVKVIALDDKSEKRIESLVPAEAKWAEAMGLGHVRIVVDQAGLGDEIVDRGGRMVYPYKGEIPKEIKDRFPKYSGGGLIFDLRYGRLTLLIRAVFVPKGNPGKPYSLFAFRGKSSQYYWYMWNQEKGFQLWDTDTGKPKVYTLQEAFESEMPRMMQEILSSKVPVKEPVKKPVKKLVKKKMPQNDIDAIRDLIERTPELFEDPEDQEVQAGLAELDLLLTSHVSTKMKELKEDVGKNFATPFGELDDRLNQVTAARELACRYVSLGMGDWLTATEQGRRIASLARNLPDGSVIAVGVGKDLDSNLNPETYKAALGLLLAPCDRLDQELRDSLGKPTKNPAKDGCLPPFHHVLVERTMTHLEQFFWECSSSREKVNVPDYLKSKVLSTVPTR